MNVSPVDTGNNWKKYKFSFGFGLGLLAIGFFLQVVGVGIPEIPTFPVNLYWGLGFANLLILVYLSFRSKKPVVWLMSVPASISAIVFYTSLLLLMGFIPQEASARGMIHQLGFDQILQSWPFFLLQLFFLITLGMVTLKRAIPFKWKNWGFMLNHSGLWLIVVAAALGSGDFMQLRMVVREGETSDLAVNPGSDQTFRMPFSIYLKDFDILEYPPKLALVNLNSGTIVASALVNDSKNISLQNWQVKIRQLEAEIHLYHFSASNNGQSKSGDLTIFSSDQRNMLQLSEDLALALLPPEPQEYLSEVQINDRAAVIKVNKPLAHAGWKIYQFSYDEQAGKNSTYTVLELVRDPWLPVVYTGLAMLMIGAVYLLWIGNRTKTAGNGLD
jgi:cytochrome c biogenesis protein ResB